MSVSCRLFPQRAGRDVHVEALIPVGVQRLLDYARRARLLAIDGGHGEGIRESCTAVSKVPHQRRGRPTEHITLVEAIGSDNCTLLAGVLGLRGAGSK